MRGEVELVLDTSAVLAYVTGSISVGETLAEVADNEALFAVSALALVEAVRLGGPGAADGTELLARHPCCEVLPLPEDWVRLGLAAHVLGRTHAAAAFLAASDFDAAILTSVPASYHPYDDDGGLTIIEI